MRKLVVMLGLVAGAALFAEGCSTRDCSEARAGQVRCIANQVETCTAEGELLYEPCSAQGLFCSEKHGGCVTQEVIDATSGSGGSTTSAGGNGEGGASAGGSSSGGEGGIGGEYGS